MGLKSDIQGHFAGNPVAFYGRYISGEFSKNGKEHFICCPFHSDSQASFAVDESGRWYCHAEKIGGDLFSFFAQLKGLDPKTQFREILSGIAADFGIRDNGKKRSGKVVARYTYTDADGKPLHRTLRWDPKSFSQQRHEGGKWLNGLKGIAPALYNLPAVAKASEVILVEGEKDADRLNGIGFVATCNAMGCGKWSESYTKTLAEKDVVLLPDADEPGRAHMRKIAASLKGKARSVKILELDGLPDGGDVSDFLDRFADPDEAAERLSVLIDNASEAEIEPESDDRVEVNADVEDLTGWLTQEPPEQQWCFDGTVPAGIVAGLNGTGGAGKSYLLESLVVGSAFGHEVFRIFKPVRPMRVLAHLGEDPAGVTRRRIFAIAKEFSGDPQELERQFIKNVWLIANKPGPLMEYDAKGNAVPAPMFEVIKAQAEQFDPDLIVIDPKAQYYGLDENSNDMNTAWVNLLKSLTAGGATVFFSHHLPKGADAFNADSFRGGGALVAACRWCMGLKSLDEKTATKYQIDDPWNYAHARITKANYSPRTEAEFFFKRIEDGVLQRVELEGTMLKIVAGKLAELLEEFYDQTDDRLTRRDVLNRKAAKDIRAELRTTTGATRAVLNSAIDYGIKHEILREVYHKPESGRGNPTHHLYPFFGVAT